MAFRNKEAVLSVLKDVIEKNIKDYLPDEYKDAEISFHEVTKNNDEKKAALIIQAEGSNVSPTIYLDPFVELYENPGISEDEILSKISEIYVSNVGSGDSFGGKLIDRISKGFESVKDIIVMQVVNTKMNETSLKDTPHREIEDLSIIYKLYLDRGIDESIGTVRISDQMMEQWGVTEQDLYDVALKNTKELLPTKILPMSTVLSVVFGSEEEIPGGGSDLYVITNERKVNGAASVFCDKEAMDELSDKFNGSMYLIPSSIHEFIALPAEGDHGMDGRTAEFASMIKEVNETTVSPEEILGTEPYHYDKENGFELAEKYEARKKGMGLEEEKTLNFVMKNDLEGSEKDPVYSKDEDPEIATPSGLKM